MYRISVQMCVICSEIWITTPGNQSWINTALGIYDDVSRCSFYFTLFCLCFTIFHNPALFIQYHPILAFQFNWQSVKKINKQTLFQWERKKLKENLGEAIITLLIFFFTFFFICLLFNITTIITQEKIYSSVNTHWPCCHTILDRLLKFSSLTWTGFRIDLYKYK